MKRNVRRAMMLGVEHVLHMQKALDQMNLQVHRVLRKLGKLLYCYDARSLRAAQLNTTKR
jgi:hypothetical protein